MKTIIFANKQDIDTLITVFETIKRLATDKENLLGNKMTDKGVFNEIRAKCIDAISYIKSSLNSDNNLTKQISMEHEFSEIKMDDDAVFTCRIVDDGIDDGWYMVADERMWQYISDGEGNVLPQYISFDEQVYFYTSLDNLQNMSDEELLSLVD